MAISLCTMPACPLCAEVVPSFSQLEEHVYSHDGLVRCEHCKEYVGKALLSDHVKAHELDEADEGASFARAAEGGAAARPRAPAATIDLTNTSDEDEAEPEAKRRRGPEAPQDGAPCAAVWPLPPGHAEAEAAAAELLSSDAAAAARLSLAFSGDREHVPYRALGWSAEQRPTASADKLYFKIVVLAHIPDEMVASRRVAGPSPHITVLLRTEREVDSPLTGARVDAMRAAAELYQGQRLAIVADCLDSSSGFTCPTGPLVRLRQAMVRAANAAEPGERRITFKSTDGGEEVIARCHITSGLQAPQALRASDFEGDQAAWITSLQPFYPPVLRGWTLPLDVTVEAREAPLACNDAIHQALLWIEDKNASAAAVAKAGVAVAESPEEVPGIGPTIGARVRAANEYLSRGMLPARAPQNG